MFNEEYNLMGFKERRGNVCGAITGVTNEGDIEVLKVEDIAFIEPHVEGDDFSFKVYRFGHENGSIYKCTTRTEKLDIVLKLSSELYDFGVNSPKEVVVS